MRDTNKFPLYSIVEMWCANFQYGDFEIQDSLRDLQRLSTLETFDDADELILADQSNKLLYRVCIYNSWATVYEEPDRQVDANIFESRPERNWFCSIFTINRLYFGGWLLTTNDTWLRGYWTRTPKQLSVQLPYSSSTRPTKVSSNSHDYGNWRLRKVF